MNRAPQIAIIVSAGVLLFVASQWPRYTVPGCIVMFGVIWVAVSRMRPSTSPGTPKRRNRLRRILGFAIAAALLVWVVFSLRQGL
jgi:hypothetical protein